MDTETNAEAGEGASGVRPVSYYVAAGVVAAIAAFAVFAFEDGDAPAQVSDARLVYCLDPVRQPAVANAAVALGLATRASGPDVVVAGRAQSVPQWRSDHRADFDRACLAQSAPVFAASGGFGSTLTALLQVTFGAALSFAAGGYAFSRERAASLAKELRSAWAQFALGVVEFTAAMPGGPNGRPSLGPLRERYTDLRTTLLRIEAHRNGWKALRDVLGEIDQGLSPSVVDTGWNVSDFDAVTARREQISGELDRQAVAIERIATAVQRPLSRRGRY